MSDISNQDLIERVTKIIRTVEGYETATVESRTDADYDHVFHFTVTRPDHPTCSGSMQRVDIMRNLRPTMLVELVKYRLGLNRWGKKL